MATDNVERHRRGIRDVQARQRPGHVETRHPVAVLARQAAQPLALGAEDQRDLRSPWRLPLRSPRRPRCRGRSAGSPGRPAGPARGRGWGTAISGSRSSAPEAALASTPVSAGACRLVETSASAPKASAERRIAPTLCGIRHLVEHHHEPRPGERVERQGLERQHLERDCPGAPRRRRRSRSRSRGSASSGNHRQVRLPPRRGGRGRSRCRPPGAPCGADWRARRAPGWMP
jgi:hypothetical protein